VDSEPDPVAENDRLRDANAGLRQVIRRQAAGLDALRADNAGLKVQVETLSEQVAELRRQLGRNSSNSSMPPSAEGLAKKPAVPRQRTARKPGKQPEAPGARLAQTDDPDEVVVHVPAVCAGCGGDLSDAPAVGIIRRQIFDLPELGLRVVEHQAQRRRCGCGQITTAALPAQAARRPVTGPGCARRSPICKSGSTCPSIAPPSCWLIWWAPRSRSARSPMW
jgi:transposase